MRVLSLGAGVQSTTLALLALNGDIPPIEHAIFADTGWEPRAVYEHLQRLTVELTNAGVQVHVVASGNLREDSLDPSHRYASMPVFLKSKPTAKNPSGNGMGRRQCTSEYKLKPIKEKVRELLGAAVMVDAKGRRRVGRVPGRPGARAVTNYVGISADEAGRIRPSDVLYIQRVDPLVELLDTPWTRTACLAYLARRWPFPVPRSACIGCPFHTNAEWRNLRDNAPTEWADAVEFDHAIRDGIDHSPDQSQPWRGKLYLHADRVPLDQARIDTPDPAIDEQASFFDEPRGCNPFDCQRGAA